ncbi:MAG: GFA family protein [Phenylobacterium sp.]
MSWSGGCQCGAVRYRVEGELGRATICHCRMCQKAMGGPFGPFVSVKSDQVEWTRGTRKRFASSNKVSRGFCADCGTPLTFEWSETVIDLAFYTFDRAEEVVPTVQLQAPMAASWVGHIADLPIRDHTTEPHLAAHFAAIVSNQHPDHDT